MEWAGEGEAGRGRTGSETYTYLVREVWPVGMISESHFDDKVEVTPSRRISCRGKKRKRPEKQ